MKPRERRRPGCRPRLEAVEDRVVLSTVPFTFTFDDPAHQLDRLPALVQAASQAQQTLSGLFDGQGSIEVVLRPDSGLPGGAAGAPASFVTVGSQSGLDVQAPGPLYEAETGADPNGSSPDIVVRLSAGDTANLANQGATRWLTRLLEGASFQGLGFVSFRSKSATSYGQLTKAMTVFDSLTAYGTGGDASRLYFDGPQAKAVYGGPVPVTTGGRNGGASDFAHLGSVPLRLGEDLEDDIMAPPENIPLVSNHEVPRPISRLDLAILADMGWRTDPVRSPDNVPALRAPTILAVSGVRKRGKIQAITMTFDQPVNFGYAMDRGYYVITRPRGKGGAARPPQVIPFRKPQFGFNPYVGDVPEILKLPLKKPVAGPLTLTVTLPKHGGFQGHDTYVIR